MNTWILQLYFRNVKYLQRNLSGEKRMQEQKSHAMDLTAQHHYTRISQFVKYKTNDTLVSYEKNGGAMRFLPDIVFSHSAMLFDGEGVKHNITWKNTKNASRAATAERDDIIAVYKNRNDAIKEGIID